MRPIWTGSLTFGLVTIPVRLYSATGGTSLDFNMLHKKDLSPIKYVRVCKEDGKEVPFDEIVKGFEWQDGDYIVLTEDDFKKANVRKTQTIDVLDFVDASEIDSVYFEKPYYLEPDKGSEKAYTLLREALKKSKKVGLGKFVLRTKEALVAVKPEGDMIILNQMRFQDELRAPKDLKLPTDVPIQQKEIDMALALIDQLTSSFKPEQYRDTYKEELEALIDQKAKGKKVKPKGEEPTATKVSDLMATLKASLEKEQSKRVHYA